MKKFSHFIIEAKETRASQQAKSRGLVGNGHGDWYNAQGEFVAKTVNGMLKFFTKGQKVGERDVPPKQGQTSQQPVSGIQRQVQNSQQASKRADVDQGEQLPDEGEYLTVILGRFNPPTKEHKQFFTAAERASLGGQIRVYPSRTQDSKQNPLGPDRKIHYMQMMFPKYAEMIINNPEIKTVFDVLIASNEEGYNNINIIVGSDRLSEIQSLVNKHNGQHYQYESINVIPTGTFDSEKSDLGVSSGMLRKKVADDNFLDFKSGMPKTMKEVDSRQLFDELRKSMGFSKKKVKESYNLWEISPGLDYENLRENYIGNKIFKIDTLVENLNTGLKGKIIRRGTNYLICVTEDNIMFKSWIKDVKEVKEIEVPFRPQSKNIPINFKEWTEVSGVPAKQREVGTPEFTKYTMKMVNLKRIRNFINNRSKK